MRDAKKPMHPVFTHEELVVINNALNEVCNGIALGDDEFQTRIGYPRAKALELLKKVSKLRVTSYAVFEPAATAFIALQPHASFTLKR